MRSWTASLLATCCLAGHCGAQVAIGVQAGPWPFTGWTDPAATQLSRTSAWSIGLQVIEGGTGHMGFRYALDLCQRSYDLRAADLFGEHMEELTARSTLLQLGAEMRFALSKRMRLFLDIGPVIGFEVHEHRQGIRYRSDALDPKYDVEQVDEQEGGFAIRDGHWRIGLSADLPVTPRLWLTAGSHACPGIGIWARGHNYRTFDAQFQLGLAVQL